MINRCLKSTYDAVHSVDYLRDILDMICEYISDFNRIATGRNCFIIIRKDGTLHSWGDDKYNQVSGTPKGSGFISVSSGIYHCIALKNDGTLHSWGYEEDDQISGTPKGSGFKSVFTGWWYSGALKEDGTCFLWGDNEFHCLPTYSILSRLSRSIIKFTHRSDYAIWFNNTFNILPIIINKSEFMSVFPSDGYCIALKDDGTLYSWGSDICNRISGTPKGSGYISVSSEYDHCIALKYDGTLHSWGDDEYNQVSDTPKGSGFLSVCSGLYRCIAVKDDGTLHLWGGDKDETFEIPEESGFVSIFSGHDDYFIAVKNDGTIMVLTEGTLPPKIIYQH